MKNRVCDILNIQYPVIQGPMAWITSSGLVAAVSNARGHGSEISIPKALPKPLACLKT